MPKAKTKTPNKKTVKEKTAARSGVALKEPLIDVKAQAPTKAYTNSAWRGLPLIVCAYCGFSTVDGMGIFNDHYFRKHAGKNQDPLPAPKPADKKNFGVPLGAYDLEVWRGQQNIACKKCGYSTIDGMKEFSIHWKALHVKGKPQADTSNGKPKGDK